MRASAWLISWRHWPASTHQSVMRSLLSLQRNSSHNLNRLIIILFQPNTWLHLPNIYTTQSFHKRRSSIVGLIELHPIGIVILKRKAGMLPCHFLLLLHWLWREHHHLLVLTLNLLQLSKVWQNRYLRSLLHLIHLESHIWLLNIDCFGSSGFSDGIAISNCFSGSTSWICVVIAVHHSDSIVVALIYKTCFLSGQCAFVFWRVVNAFGDCWNSDSGIGGCVKLNASRSDEIFSVLIL